MTGVCAGQWRGLLVSVRSVAEAHEALAGGATIVDVKEPRRGPLGAADAPITGAIGETVGCRVPWTVACGELSAGPRGAAACIDRCRAQVAAERLPTGAKAGPAGLDERAWRQAFGSFAAALPTGTAPIAVAYVDWSVAHAPRPEAIIAGAADVGSCAALLFDTFDKRGPTVFELAGDDVLRGWIDAARVRGFVTALAGRLTLETLPRAAALGADVLAIRGAACVGGRAGRVCRHRVEAARHHCGKLRWGADAPPVTPHG